MYWVHKTSVTSIFFIEVPVPCQESELSCMCVRDIDFATVCRIFSLDFGTVPRVWYFFSFYCTGHISIFVIKILIFFPNF